MRYYCKNKIGIKAFEFIIEMAKKKYYLHEIIFFYFLIFYFL